MASSSSVSSDKSQPLHDFQDSELKWKWKTNGQSRSDNQRRRISKSQPTRAPKSSTSPFPHSPMQASVSPMLSHCQFPLQCDASPVSWNNSIKESSLIGELVKQSNSGSSGSEKASSFLYREEAHHFMRPELGLESKSPSNNRDASKINKAISSSNSKKTKHVVKQKKSKSTKIEFIAMKGNKPAESEDASKGEKPVDAQVTQKSMRSNILIKHPSNNTKHEEINLLQKINIIDKHGETDEAKEEEEIVDDIKDDDDVKMWNLRPRKPICRPKYAAPDDSSSKVAKSWAKELGGGGVSCDNKENKENQKLSISISLTKQEIAEDLFTMTGKKPARRPKRRAKKVQKQLDTLFPGLWLLSISANTYKVSENSVKEKC